MQYGTRECEVRCLGLFRHTHGKALSDARKRFRALRGFVDMPKLIAALQSRIPVEEVQQMKVA
jgi:hypothetical protein